MARTATLAQMFTISQDDGVKAFGLIAIIAILADVLNDPKTPDTVKEFARLSAMAPEQYAIPLARAIAVDEVVQSKVIVKGRVDMSKLEDADILRVAMACFLVMSPA